LCFVSTATCENDGNGGNGGDDDGDGGDNDGGDGAAWRSCRRSWIAPELRRRRPPRGGEGRSDRFVTSIDVRS
jgi:hypothetical protein